MVDISLPGGGTAESPTVPVYPYDAFTITPSNTDTFPQPVTVCVGGAGVVMAVPWSRGISGAAVPASVPAGGDVKFQVIMVKATGTTATLMYGVY